MKKFNIIVSICLIFAFIALILLYNPTVNQIVSNWIGKEDKVVYELYQRVIFITIMLGIFFGIPIFLIVFTLTRKIVRFIKNYKEQ